MRHQLIYERMTPEAVAPSKAHPDDLGWDFYLPRRQDNWGVLVPGRGPKRLHLSIRLELPPGLGLVFKDRSSMADLGIHLLGGVIDPSYRGELSIVLVNLGVKDFWFLPGQKIVQGILVPLIEADAVEGPVSTATLRGEKGFGSSNNTNNVLEKKKK